MARSAGLVEVTLGSVVSTPAPVVKFHTKSAASGAPPRLLAPVIIVAVNSVLAAKVPIGAKIAMPLAAS